MIIIIINVYDYHHHHNGICESAVFVLRSEEKSL